MKPVTYENHQSWWDRYGRTTSAALASAALAFAAGWILAPAKPQPAPVLQSNPSAEAWNLPGLSAPQQQALDDAFATLRKSRYPEAEEKFNALLKQQPLWTSLNSDLACLAAYQRDEKKLRALSDRGQHDGSLLAADGKGLVAMRLVKPGTFKAADETYAEAAAADPTRADTFDQWGDCLLRWGKPAEAVHKYRAALLRSNFPVMDDLYRAKLLLARMEAGEDTPDSSFGRQIDAALAAPEPTNAALFAGAARAVRAERFADAATLLARARRVSAPSMFRALLFSPCFERETTRPELRPFFLAAGPSPTDPLDPLTDDRP
jgi:hypothetical protein